MHTKCNGFACIQDMIVICDITVCSKLYPAELPGNSSSGVKTGGGEEERMVRERTSILMIFIVAD